MADVTSLGSTKDGSDGFAAASGVLTAVGVAMAATSVAVIGAVTGAAALIAAAGLATLFAGVLGDFVATGLLAAGLVVADFVARVVVLDALVLAMVTVSHCVSYSETHSANWQKIHVKTPALRDPVP